MAHIINRITTIMIMILVIREPSEVPSVVVVMKPLVGAVPIPVMVMDAIVSLPIICV
jgi:hypothetical protein